MSKLNKINLKSKKKSRTNKKDNEEFKELTSAEDFLNQGTLEEESGDRFTLSDLSKSLRFYQKSFEYYLQAQDLSVIELNLAKLSKDLKNQLKQSQLLLDSVYNSSRLLFHIYNEFIKNESINFEIDMKNIGLVIDSDYSILKPLEKILKSHEDAIGIYESLSKDFANVTEFPFVWDLYYNTCLVYTELIEDCNDDEINVEILENWIDKCIILFKEILDYQVKELQKLVEEEAGNTIHEEIIEQEENDDDDEEEYSSQETIVPNTVFETLISSYSLIQAIFETMNLNPIYQEQLNPNSLTKIEEFELDISVITNELINNFSNDTENSTEEPTLLAPIEKDSLTQLNIIKKSIKGLQCQTLDLLIENWQDINNCSSDFYSMIADNFHNFYEKSNKNPLRIAEHWRLLGIISSYYKKSQDECTKTFKKIQQESKINPNNSSELSPVINQLVLIIISRVDLDVIKIYNPDFQKIENDFNKLTIQNGKIDEILLKNVDVNLKNCLKYLSINCGLREKIFDKLTKRQLKSQILVRQYILKLINNVQASKEEEKTLIKLEMKNLKDVDAYKSFQFPF